MTDDSESHDEIAQTIKNARNSFGLRDRLKGAGIVEDEITLYTDRQAGRALGNAEIIEDKNTLGMIVNVRKIREGVIGEIAKLDDKFDEPLKKDESDVDAKARKTLEKRKQELIAKLESTALEATLRSVPEIVIESIDRETRAELKLSPGEMVQSDNALHWSQVSEAKLLSHMVVKLVDRKDGEDLAPLNFEDAKSLREYLPRSEYARLKALANDLQFKAVVADSVTKQADF